MKIGIISPDAVKLELTKDYPSIKVENGVEYSFVSKCVHETALGKRARICAEYLSKENDVTLLIPDLNFPGHAYINYDTLNYAIKEYDWHDANWKTSKSLYSELVKYDVIIIQSTTGTGFLDVARLPKNITVVVDGWVPFLVEFPSALLSYTDEKIRNAWWKKGSQAYKKLIDRADCILYANKAQFSYYAGLLSSNVNNGMWNNINKFKLVELKYGIGVRERKIHFKDTPELKLVWFGPIYPWYDPTPILNVINELENISIDFVSVEHPRFKKLFYEKYKNILDNNHVKYTKKYIYEPFTELYEYDAGIIMSQEWNEEYFSNRCRIMDMVALGLPVITNSVNPFFQYESLQSVLHPTTKNTIRTDLLHLRDNKHELRLFDIEYKEIIDEFHWDKCFIPILKYLRGIANA
jgi:hypothetical protein